MNLYVWRPQGHGEHTFSIVAESSWVAVQAVNEFIKERYTREDGTLKYEAGGWGTSYYKLRIYKIGQVFEHEND